MWTIVGVEFAVVFRTAEVAVRSRKMFLFSVNLLVLPSDGRSLLRMTRVTAKMTLNDRDIFKNARRFLEMTDKTLSAL